MTTDSTGDWTPERGAALLRDVEEREQISPDDGPARWAPGDAPRRCVIVESTDVRAALREIERLTLARDIAETAEHRLTEERDEARGMLKNAYNDRDAMAAEIERLTAELAARAPADASLEVMAMRAALTAVGFPVQDGESLDKAFARAWEWCTEMAHMARGTSVDASRPGLTEEQRDAWERLRRVAAEIVELEYEGAFRVSDSDATRFDELRAALAAPALRASRGETGPAAPPPGSGVLVPHPANVLATRAALEAALHDPDTAEGAAALLADLEAP